MSLKKIFLTIGLILGLLLAGAGFYLWRFFRKLMAGETLQPDPQLTIITGGGGNSILLTAEDGSKALVVDTKLGEDAQKLRDRVTAPEVIVVNTHAHPDHTGGNDLYPQATLIAGAYDHETWPEDRYPDQVLQPGEEKIVSIGSETVHIFNVGPAHSQHDVVVYLENRKLLVAGDIVVSGFHPMMVDPAHDCRAWAKALDTLAQKYAVQVCVPGHGPLGDSITFQAQREYFADALAALDAPQKMEMLKQKYARYLAIPGVANFEHTLEELRA